jgi:uncharacterized protein
MRFLVLSAFLAGFILSPYQAAAKNRLASETSPYLQLHASDPVAWRAWSAETLEAAKKAGKPILLSIGYTACHWCHVMQRESFENAKTAAIINAKFFPILVDREERPDVDDVFQAAATIMGVSTGWPLTMFATPDAKPFWGGGYFPNRPLAGMTPFNDTLIQVATAYYDDPRAARFDATMLGDLVVEFMTPKPGALSPDHINTIAKQMNARIDPLSGGFKGPPKFPRTPALELLWRASFGADDTDFRDSVLEGLRHMGNGGFFDHVGGGFFRYTEDNEWLTPHFEKMLNVNAALLGLMVEAFRETNDPFFKDRAHKTAAFMVREMRTKDGAFAASLDSDSLDGKGEMHEGEFYAWSDQNITDILKEDAKAFLGIYALAPLRGRKMGVLYLAQPLHAKPSHTASLERLYVARKKRHRPRLDDKILSGWNAMAITALAKAADALDEPALFSAALEAFSFVETRLSDNKGRLRHSWRDGKTSTMASLSDLAEMAGAAISLYEATGNKTYLERAKAWADDAVSHHLDKKDGAFFSSADDIEASVARVKPVFDRANWSGNARMVETLARLYYLDGNDAWKNLAERNLAALAGITNSGPIETAALLNAAHTLFSALQVVIVGSRGDGNTKRLLKRLSSFSLPGLTLQVIGPQEELPENHPARRKGQIDNRATAYVCRGPVCSLPVTNEEALGKTLDRMRQNG